MIRFLVLNAFIAVYTILFCIWAFLLSLFGLDVAGGGLIFSMLTAILGACILLWLVRLVTARR